METNLLRGTGLTLSAIGLGASSLGGGVFGDVCEPVAINTVHAALACGVTLIDVSPFYGNTRAETVLGKALIGVPRDRFVLSTKVGRYGGDVFDFSPERVQQSVEESLGRLGLDYIDILHAHDVEYGDLEFIASETVPALHRVVEQGKARCVGATGYPLAALGRMLESSQINCVLSYNHCSLNDTSLLDVLPEWEEKGIGVISAGALSQGLLIEGELPAWHPAPSLVRQTCARMVRFLISQDVDPASFAVRFATLQKGISSTLIGAKSPEQIESAVRAAEEPMDYALLEKVLDILAPIHNIGWQTGRAENN